MIATEATPLQRLVIYKHLELPLVARRLKRLFRVNDGYREESVHIPISAPTKAFARSLVVRSEAQPLELCSAVPWNIGIDKRRPAKMLSQLWMFGTPFHTGLSDEQQIEMSWLEIARDVSSLIKLKESTSALYTLYLNRHKRSLPAEIQTYLQVHAKEEIEHALALNRYMTMAGLPTYRSFPAYGHIAGLFPEMHPSIGILGNLLLSWIIDAGAMYATQAGEVDPLTRSIFKLHHADKKRHLDLSRQMVEDYLTDCGRQERHRLRLIFSWVIPDMLASYRFEPEIARHTSFNLPFNTGRSELVWAVRGSAHNNLLDHERFKALESWLWTMALT